ncbi:MAG TPA: hypothetical protein VL337_02540 [Acidimicrobiales bacterium]|nr:hypothetical protein [Acidimicrobiales bacterium]
MASRRPSARTAELVLDRRGALVLAGVAGVVLAHGLDYVLAVRSVAARAQILAQTGHAWWPSAVGAALASACLAVSMATARGAAGAVSRRAVDTATGTFRRELAWMALWQGALFTGVEVVERVAAHRSPVELLHGPLFPLGLVLQVVVAALLVTGLRLAERAGSTVSTALASRRRPRRRAGGVVFPASAGWVVVAGVAGPHEARGPPLRLVA